MKVNIYPLIVLLAVSLSSCVTTLKPFTQTDKKELKLGENELKRVQFYVSEDIVLQRKAGAESREIEDGKIRVVDGEKIEEVIVKKGTPGVLEYYPGDGRMGITFEDGEGRYLMFGPNPIRDGRFFLFGSEWKNNIGKITYEDKTYYTAPGCGNAYLLVDLKKLKKTTVSQRQAEGRKVN